MRVCFLSTEIFAWGKHGGYGRATRTIGRELAQRGVEVFAVVPRRGVQRDVESLDGITVLGYPIMSPWRAAALCREADADVYHSQEPSTATWLAMRAMPDRAHVVTMRDPHTWADWRTELAHPSLSRLQVLANLLYEDNPLVHRAVRRADARFCAADCIREKTRDKYGLGSIPGMLPTPVLVPSTVRKAAEPTVCYLARWDRRKRPELFLDLVPRFPQVRFIAVGRSRDAGYDTQLRATYGHLPNLELPGFVDQFDSERLSAILSRSWIVANTAAREGLPNAFIEAAAHRCAILSEVDPDGFASSFGARVEGGDFAAGLRFLLEDDRWRELGVRAGAYAQVTFEMSRAVDRHVEIYAELVGAAAVADAAPAAGLA
ncbi:MAG: glycosyltransferase family 4 protein [Gemmatimonadales bacterium]